MLLRMLRANPSLASEDLGIMLSADAATYDDAQDRVTFLLQSAEVARWLASPNSATLVVNGSEVSDSPEAATLLFSAMLVRALQKSRGGLVLYWFCSQRLHDPVQRMLRNLLCQLLDRLSPDVDLPDVSETGSPDDVGELTHLLRVCLQKELRHRPIFCILDAVMCYEDGYRSRDMCHVFSGIAALTTANTSSKQDTAFPLKLLAASSTRAFDITRTRQAMNAVVLNAPDDVDGAVVDLEEMNVLQHTRACLEGPSARGGLRRTS